MARRARCVSVSPGRLWNSTRSYGPGSKSSAISRVTQGSASGKNTARRAPASGSNSLNANFGNGAQISLWIVRREARRRLAGQQGGSDSLSFLRRQFASNIHERIARSRRSLRAPDQALESEDERVYLRRT